MKENIVERKIMWGDLDSLGIVFYPRYYEWIDASGHLFFKAINLNLGKLWRERKILFGLAETSSRYYRPGKYDQTIRIITNIDDLQEKTVLLKHSIYESENNVLMVEGYEKRICLDVSNPENFCAIDIPDDIHAMLKY
ncbi:MAG TPA: hypothetical protein DDW42_09730 [Desulfobacteraceae bacterium]|nr:hypothetical protein [Desulfobacteraceae bacterium]